MLPTQWRRTSDLLSPAQWLRDDFDHLLGRVLGQPNGGTTVAAYPVDIREDDQAVYVDAELPGFTKDQVDVTFENTVLTITAERKDEPETKGEKHLTERRYHKVQRSFTLPMPIDETKVDAKLSSGVLHLTLPKREEAKPHRIQVS